ncbi:Hypothetical predicted protein [Pelobates cultripes]|uniref:Uncharacterized protein n=1 Tax=Pelobates cultripes TaxID=61616 RepID=A0AAD1SEN1_PELCU|nr:Hypothetical predicted protein [Pelobates cultripes]
MSVTVLNVTETLKRGFYSAFYSTSAHLCITSRYLSNYSKWLPTVTYPPHQPIPQPLLKMASNCHISTSPADTSATTQNGFRLSHIQLTSRYLSNYSKWLPAVTYPPHQPIPQQLLKMASDCHISTSLADTSATTQNGFQLSHIQLTSRYLSHYSKWLPAVTYPTHQPISQQLLKMASNCHISTSPADTSATTQNGFRLSHIQLTSRYLSNYSKWLPTVPYPPHQPIPQPLLKMASNCHISNSPADTSATTQNGFQLSHIQLTSRYLSHYSKWLPTVTYPPHCHISTSLADTSATTQNGFQLSHIHLTSRYLSHYSKWLPAVTYPPHQPIPQPLLNRLPTVTYPPHQPIPQPLLKMASNCHISTSLADTSATTQNGFQLSHIHLTSRYLSHYSKWLPLLHPPSMSRYPPPSRYLATTQNGFQLSYISTTSLYLSHYQNGFPHIHLTSHTSATNRFPTCHISTSTSRIPHTTKMASNCHIFTSFITSHYSKWLPTVTYPPHQPIPQPLLKMASGCHISTSPADTSATTQNGFRLSHIHLTSRYLSHYSGRHGNRESDTQLVTEEEQCCVFTGL